MRKPSRGTGMQLSRGRASYPMSKTNPSTATLEASINDLTQKHFARSIGASAVVQDVIARIDVLVGQGTLAPGERVVEPDLCKLLGEGRGPVREALRILAGDGVIELVPNRGARVRRLSNDELRDRSMVLSALYCLGVEQFTQQTGDTFDSGMAMLRYLSNKIQGMDESSHPLSFMALITQYHIVVNHHSGNGDLGHSVSRLHVHHFQRQLAAAMNLRFLVDSGRRYRDITEAIANRDAAQAIKLTRAVEVSIATQLV